MKLLRNAEVYRSVLIFLLVGLLATCIGFALGERLGWCALLLTCLFSALHLGTTALRYRKIAQLSHDIDRILHDQLQLQLHDCEEGELAILHSEINKMTIMLHQQQSGLQADKCYLADSIADISHQLRTPLTSVNLLLAFLSEPALSETRRKQIVHEMERLLKRIDWLITSLLKISKLDAGTIHFQQKPVLLAELVRAASEPLLIPIELRQQELHISVAAQDSFCGDFAWTCEAVSNIIKNCMEHTPDGGQLSVSASENAIYTELVISDTGSGIDAADLPHIFERFYKGKDAGENSIGIGLALARTIVVRQNGTLKAENKTGGGAKFTIRFYKGTV